MNQQKKETCCCAKTKERSEKEYKDILNLVLDELKQRCVNI